MEAEKNEDAHENNDWLELGAGCCNGWRLSLGYLGGRASLGGSVIQVALGPKLFSFNSFAEWVDYGQHIWKQHGVSSRDTLCLDQMGRICAWGRHFMAARDDDAFPVDVYMLREE